MADESFFDRMFSQLRSKSKYYTGYPKDLGPSRIIPFTSERQFVQLLHEGRPVVVAFTIKCTYTQHLDKVLEEAAATFYPHIKFVRVECPKYPSFCLTRQKTEYPFLEVFYNPEQERLRIQTSRSIQQKFYLSTMTRACMVFENISRSMDSSILKQSRFVMEKPCRS
ncbi:unnamed protein product [Alopecurus aequalis]